MARRKGGWQHSRSGKPGRSPVARFIWTAGLAAIALIEFWRDSHGFHRH